MASCALSVGRTVQHHGVLPATATLVVAQAAAHFKPGGYSLLKVSLSGVACACLGQGHCRKAAGVVMP